MELSRSDPSRLFSVASTKKQGVAHTLAPSFMATRKYGRLRKKHNRRKAGAHLPSVDIFQEHRIPLTPLLPAREPLTCSSSDDVFHMVSSEEEEIGGGRSGPGCRAQGLHRHDDLNVAIPMLRETLDQGNPDDIRCLRELFGDPTRVAPSCPHHEHSIPAAMAGGGGQNSTADFFIPASWSYARQRRFLSWCYSLGFFERQEGLGRLTFVTEHCIFRLYCASHHRH